MIGKNSILLIKKEKTCAHDDEHKWTKQKEYKQIKILIDPKSIQYPQTNSNSAPSKHSTSNNPAPSSTHPSHASQNDS